MCCGPQTLILKVFVNVALKEEGWVASPILILGITIIIILEANRVPFSLLYGDPKVEFGCTHARTNWHPNNAFSQCLRKTMLKYEPLHPSQKSIVVVPICSGMGATNSIFKALTEFISVTNYFKVSVIPKKEWRGPNYPSGDDKGLLRHTIYKRVNYNYVV